MSIETALRSHLLGLPGMEGLVGSRNYPVVLPQDVTYPALVYRLVSDVTDPLLTGRSNIRRARIEVGCWSTDFDQAKAIIKIIRDAVDGECGMWSGLEVYEVRVENEFDDYGEEVRAYVRQLDLFILYIEGSA